MCECQSCTRLIEAVVLEQKDIISLVGLDSLMVPFLFQRLWLKIYFNHLFQFSFLNAYKASLFISFFKKVAIILYSQQSIRTTTCLFFVRRISISKTSA